ncbi:MAG: GNAT family N-acetyltransferase [Holosporales bacterium]|jgi:hypothetical protein|nr:GNAT family N-acetyltransferase [Holosporales bacterium]
MKSFGIFKRILVLMGLANSSVGAMMGGIHEDDPDLITREGWGRVGGKLGQIFHVSANYSVTVSGGSVHLRPAIPEYVKWYVQIQSSIHGDAPGGQSPTPEELEERYLTHKVVRGHPIGECRRVGDNISLNLILFLVSPDSVSIPIGVFRCGPIVDLFSTSYLKAGDGSPFPKGFASEVRTMVIMPPFNRKGIGTAVGRHLLARAPLYPAGFKAKIVLAPQATATHVPAERLARDCGFVAVPGGATLDPALPGKTFPCSYFILSSP